MDQSIAADNATELARLKRVANALDARELACPMPAGWTVAAVLGHLAFWDMRALEIIRRTTALGVLPSPVDSDLVNEAMRPLLRAVPSTEAARLSVTAAEAVSAAVAAASDDLLAALDTLGDDFWPRRCRHWRKHLDDIERALAARDVGAVSG